MGRTKVRESPLLRIQRRDSGDSVIADGAVSDDGRVIGTYMHGLFDDPRVRAALRSWTGAKPVALGIHSREFRQEQYDALAALLRKTLRLDKIKAAMGPLNAGNMRTAASEPLYGVAGQVNVALRRSFCRSHSPRQPRS